ncbi:outer membrane protein with beta-barrel domain [Leeuwenhoekiella aestuarii]|uniref:Outer membrane protein with beta-barrel domain n=1 Tax=Leeuwenhoekiella aestuarii TaxID=2249426 RepID=A0A4Q0NY92_9FLAO|nr:outer membrane beta-barrel protein [Leeuwenhoekiella aestuarii]RXG17883.1 outer membrane protein with beta-barrel domain [Leeuwenhoekiella aestuarii]RXG19212.1 outer membrane protein with beta-barrel domain [Leeuwenhoekiella aestuarii]
MKEQKNIDRLFQEKFKNFEAEPGDQVWANIAAQQQNNNKTIIPLWLKISGAAAALLLLFLSGNVWFKTNLNPEVNPAVVIEETATDIENENSIKVTKKETPLVTSQKTEDNTESSEQLKNTKNPSKNLVTTPKNNTVVSTKQNTSSSVNSTQNSSPENSNILSQSGNENDNAVANILSSEITKKDEVLNENTSVEKSNKVAVADNTEETNFESEAKIDPDALEKIANQSKEQAIAETEETSETINRWGISPMVAPVYYNSFGGSGIDAEFSNNKKSGDVNLSYGLQVSYALNNRLTVRSGINRVDLGYKTEQVSFSPSIQPSTISSINYNDNAGLIQLSSSNKSSLVNSPSSNAAEFDTNTINSSNALNQQLGYIEIPVEAEYALINNKIGVQLIGGLSTLFLNNNSITLEEGNNIVSELGESNSLNATSFSTNVGLGFDYKFTDRIQFNLEPMFKYQINAYNKSVSDFKPYYLGLYTGFSIKF